MSPEEQADSEDMAEDNRRWEQEAVEIEKAAPEGAESMAVNDNPDERTEAEQRVLEEYKNAVDEALVKFYEQAKTNQDGKPYVHRFQPFKTIFKNAKLTKLKALKHLILQCFQGFFMW